MASNYKESAVAPKQLNQNAQYLRDQLAATKANESARHTGATINVAGVGGMVSSAYEQLRNAAEYTQEHLLRQSAMRRFYVRNLQFRARQAISKAKAEELIIELTQSGYIENDSQPVEVVDKLREVIERHYNNYFKLKDTQLKASDAQQITLDLLTVESEKLLSDDPRLGIFTHFAFRHYLSILSKESFRTDGVAGEDNFDVCLYIAVHKALLKSNLANVRYDLQQLYQTSDQNSEQYAKFHANIDKLFYSELTDKLTRYINKYGAPLRIFKDMIENNKNIDSLLLDSSRFAAAYEENVKTAYSDAKKKLNKGVIKSIIFLFITKALIGLAIEIPYDILVAGHILIVPLIINLLVPVIYMALLRAGLKLPGNANTKALRLYAQNMLYEDANASLYPSPKKGKYPVGFKIAYGLMFIVVFGLMTERLIGLDFNIVQAAIFFVFLATASFLGFRLSRIVRELELVVAKPGLLATIRDFLYMPFILVGQWLSEKYQKVNVVALILDTIVELPLKTILRLIRQWTGFISEKKDEI